LSVGIAEAMVAARVREVRIEKSMMTVGLGIAERVFGSVVAMVG